MRAAGFHIDATDTENLGPVKSQFGVPQNLQSCHTGFVDGYVVEGHVPANDVKRLLIERSNALGLAVPGMPVGSPGMEVGDQKDPFDVILFGNDGQSVFAEYR